MPVLALALTPKWISLDERHDWPHTTVTGRHDEECVRQFFVPRPRRLDVTHGKAIKPRHHGRQEAQTRGLRPTADSSVARKRPALHSVNLSSTPVAEPAPERGYQGGHRTGRHEDSIAMSRAARGWRFRSDTM